MRRYGMVTGLRPQSIEEYKRLHAAVWPEVLATIRDCNIANYSIFLRTLDDGRPYLFAYFEYHGTDFAADMAKMAADPATRRGGRCASPASTSSPTVHPTSGGFPWRKCSTRAECSC